MEEEHSKSSYGSEDEINLYELYLVLKRRYKLILAIFLAAVVFAGAVSFLMPSIYRVSVFLTPGWLGIAKDGHVIYIDSAESISSPISEGSYNMQIIEALGLDPKEYMEKMEFEVSVPRDSHVVKVSYETEDPKQGTRVMEELLNLIQRFYRNRCEVRKEEKENAIQLLRNRMSVLENKKAMILNEKKKISGDIKLQKKKLSLLEDMGKFLVKQLEKTEKNTQDIIEQRSEMLKGGGKADAVSLLLYSNTIQQNIAETERVNFKLKDNMLAQNEARNQIKKLNLQLKDEDLMFKNVNTEIEDTSEKIKGLKLQMKKIEGILVIQQPTVSSKPVKPKKALNVAVAGVGGLFLGMFWAFFVEWVERRKRESA
jgi:uncharacterized protein involved in exopolysaccharide biosynthesis